MTGGRKLLHFLVPGGAVLLLVLGLRLSPAVAPRLASFWELYPAVVLAAGLLLAWRFEHSRLLFLLLVLILAERAALIAPTGQGRTFVLAGVGLLLPVNFVWLSLLRERGFLTNAGLLRLLWIATQALMLVWLFRGHFAATLRFFKTPWLPFLPATLLSLPVNVVLIHVVALLLLLLRYLWRPGIFEGVLFWSALASLAGLAHYGSDTALVWFTTAALGGVIAVLESSHFMAYRDELTGLPGRRALFEFLPKLEGRYTLAMVDVDHFKKVNDTYGHDVGDQVLRMVASVLQRVPGGGRAFRYGGEEFTLVFPGKGRTEAGAHLETVRRSLEEAPFLVRGPGRPEKKPRQPRSETQQRSRLRVTASFGAAVRSGALNEPEELIKAADEALYRAKTKGRNQVCFAGQG